MEGGEVIEEVEGGGVGEEIVEGEVEGGGGRWKGGVIETVEGGGRGEVIEEVEGSGGRRDRGAGGRR